MADCRQYAPAVNISSTGPKGRLSVPPRVRTAPRELTEAEWTTLEAAASSLIPAFGESPSASQAPDYRDWVRRALAARAEHFELVIEAISELDGVSGGDLRGRLETMSASKPQHFAVLSSVIAGAYVMVPLVREQIGYPGQGGATPRFDEAVEQLEDGILDPVVVRGPIYTPAAGE
jgi:hypothetical protein